jgi:hypothetical protein
VRTRATHRPDAYTCHVFHLYIAQVRLDCLVYHLTVPAGSLVPRLSVLPPCAVDVPPLQVPVHHWTEGPDSTPCLTPCGQPRRSPWDFLYVQCVLAAFVCAAGLPAIYCRTSKFRRRCRGPVRYTASVTSDAAVHGSCSGWPERVCVCLGMGEFQGVCRERLWRARLASALP